MDEMENMVEIMVVIIHISPPPTHHPAEDQPTNGNPKVSPSEYH